MSHSSRRGHFTPNGQATTTPIPRCRCGATAFGMDLSTGTPVCEDHFIDWLERATAEQLAFLDIAALKAAR